ARGEWRAGLLGDAQDGPPVFRTDAARLEKAGVDLDVATKALLDPASRPTDVPPPEVVRRTRHDLMNVLNRLLGYSQLLLEAEEDEQLFGNFRTDLQRTYDLAKECERIILLHLARPNPEGQPAPSTVVVAPPPSTGTGPPSATQAATPCTILIVDDDELGRTAVSRALKAQGHTLIEADSGERGVELIKGRSFDLVLLDINMPGMNGYEVLRFIRSDPRRDVMPVLMISGLDEISHTVRCIEAGAE